MKRFAAVRFGVLAVVLCAPPAAAQVVELDLRTSFFYEPSSTSEMTVLTPSAEIAARPWEFLTINAGWEADIVSGASESVKAGPVIAQPDIVSAASVTDFRNVGSGGLTLQRRDTRLGAAYSYGTERDYRSQAVTVSAGSDFLQRNTQIEISYSHAFDEVCTSAYEAARDPSRRPALDSSDGCFTSADDRQTQDVDQDNFQGGWTQAWTPVFATQLVLTGSLQSGYLGNPYRAVILASTGERAAEFHPDDRARIAAAVRGKIFVRPIETAFGAGFRLYRDTWDLLSQTYEVEAERHMLSWLRLRLRGRYYTQTGALFWSDDYTGGEPTHGPRGKYWSGDRELSPLTSLLLGGRVMASWDGRPGDRIAGMFLELDAGGGLDVIDTTLDDFTWGGQDPDDTLSFITSLSVTAGF